MHERQTHTIALAGALILVRMFFFVAELFQAAQLQILGGKMNFGHATFFGLTTLRLPGSPKAQRLPAVGGAIALTLALTTTAAFADSRAPVILEGDVSSGGSAKIVPIGGATVTVFQAGSSSPLAAGRSDKTGKFTLPLTYDPTGGVLYAVARQGQNIELRTVIGERVSGPIVINEMTTVASAYALARILQNGAVPSEPQLPARIAASMSKNLVSPATGMPSTLMQTSPNANETNAWRLLGTLSNILANCVRNSGSACSTLFSLATPPEKAPPTTTWGAILDIARNPAANVNALFALGEPTKAFEPNLTARFGPDARDEFMRLDAFTLAIKFNASGRIDWSTGQERCPFAGPGNFVFDANGYAWITNNVVQGTPNSTNCMIVLKPNGLPSDGEKGTPVSPVIGGGILGQGFGLGFDPSGDMWSGNFGWGNKFPTDAQGNPVGSVSKFTGGGQPLSPRYGFIGDVYRVQGTVSDRQGNIWLASYGNNEVQILPHGDPFTHYPFYQDANLSPFDIRLDNDGSGWVVYTGSSAVSKFTRTNNGLQLQFSVPVGTNSQPKGLAVDSHGNAWISAGAENAVYAFDRNGNPLGKFTGGGIIGPWGAATDSDDVVWAANFGELKPEHVKYSVSALCGATISKCPPGLRFGDPISPKTGYTLPSGGDEVLLHNGQPLYYPLPNKSFQPLMRLTAAHPDAAGNLWVTDNWKPAFGIDVTSNPGGDGMVVFVGLAAPVEPQLYSAPSASPFNGK
jgi:hypothetical protein